MKSIQRYLLGNSPLKTNSMLQRDFPKQILVRFMQQISRNCTTYPTCCWIQVVASSSISDVVFFVIILLSCNQLDFGLLGDGY